LGEAKILRGDRAGAIEAFARSLELNPRYEFGGNWLFDLQLEDGKLDEAAQTLEVMRHSENPYVLARRAILAARKHDKSTALDLLRQLCVAPSESSWSVSAPVEEMLKEGWRRASWHEEVEKVLVDAIAKEEVVPEVGAQWGALMASQKRPLKAEQFVPLLARGAIGERAIYAYMDRLQHERQFDQVVRFARQAWPILRQHFWAWASIGMGLVRIGRYDLALPWQSLWRDYPDAQPWMLINVVEALRAAGRDDEAREASRVALAKPDSSAHSLHRLWRASDAALDGEFSQVREHLAACGDGKLSDHYQFHKTLVECALEMHDAVQDGTAPAAFAAVRRKLAAARRGFAPFASEPARKKLYYRTLALVARLRGTLLARLWYWARLVLE
jgi:tetratricopeptide (TPR) repeat protein